MYFLAWSLKNTSERMKNLHDWLSPDPYAIDDDHDHYDHHGLFSFLFDPPRRERFTKKPDLFQPREF